MQFLPSIEVLGFLDWMDRGGIAEYSESTIEELILDPENQGKLVSILAAYNASNQRRDNAAFERRLEFCLREIIDEVMNEVRRQRPLFGDHIGADRLEDMMYSAMNRVVRNHGQRLNGTADSSSIAPREMVDRLRSYLNNGGYKRDELVSSVLNSSENTTAHAVYAFRKWVKDNLNDAEIYQIPDSQKDVYVRRFTEAYYQSHPNVSHSKIQMMEKCIKNAIYNPGNHNYFNHLMERYRDRVAHYKCVFISEDAAFYDLVEQHWLQLNEYTGDYLDVFYNPKELQPYRGYRVADALDIRSRIDKFPCIYIWRTVISAGKAIDTKGLDFEDLLQLVKEIVDTIQEGKALDEVIDSGNKYAEQMRQQIRKSRTLEEKVLSNLIRAGMQLQNNPVIYSDTNEDQKNTHIRDLMRNLFISPVSIGDKKYSVRVDDQGFNGLSASGKSLGKPDLFVTVETLPFCIIEGVNITSGVLGRVNEQSKLYEHIVRFGNYDQNGLERNILLVYVKTDMFTFFYRSLLQLVMNNPNATIRGSYITDLADFPLSELDFPDYAAIRLAKGKYDYCGSERSFYICVVKVGPYKNNSEQ